MSINYSQRWQKDAEKNESYYNNQRSQPLITQKPKIAEAERNTREQYSYANKDYISNITPKKEEIHRSNFVNDFLEQKTAQKKASTYVGDTSGKQVASIERAKQLALLHSESRNAQFYGLESDSPELKEKSGVLSEVRSYVGNHREQRKCFNPDGVTNFESLEINESRGKENANHSLIKPQKKMNAEPSSELFDDYDPRMGKSRTHLNYVEQRPNERSPQNFSHINNQNFIGQKSKSKPLKYTTDDLINSGYDVVPSSIRESGKLSEQRQFQRAFVSNEESNARRNTLAISKPSKREIMKYPEEEDRELPETPRSEEEYQHRPQEMRSRNEYAKQEQDAESEEEQQDEMEYDEQYQSEYSQNDDDDKYDQQEENEEDSQCQRYSDSEHQQEQNEDYYSNQSPGDQADSIYHEENEDYLSYDQEGATISKQYYQKQKLNERQLGKNQKMESQESDEEEIQIYEIKLKNQQKYQQPTKINKEGQQQAQTYSQIHGKAQKVSKSENCPPISEKKAQVKDNGPGAIKREILQTQINYHNKEIGDDDEARNPKDKKQNKVTSKITETTKPKSQQNLEHSNDLKNTPLTHKKVDLEHENSNNPQTQPFIQSNFNQQNILPQSHQIGFMNNLVQSQQYDIGCLQQSAAWVQNSNLNPAMYGQGIQSPSGSMINPAVYFPNGEIQNQQIFYQQSYNQIPYHQPYQQFVTQGFQQIPNSQFVMPQIIGQPYQIPTNNAYHPGFIQHYPTQSYPIYSEEVSNNRWPSQDHLIAQSISQSEFPTNKQYSGSNESVSSRKFQETNENSVSSRIKIELNEKNEIKNYLKDQEDFLRKLEEDKKLQQEKIEKAKLQSDSQSTNKVKRETILQQIETKQNKKSINSEEKSSKEELQVEFSNEKKRKNEKIPTSQDEQKENQPNKFAFAKSNFEKNQMKKPEIEQKTTNTAQKNESKSKNLEAEENVAEEFNEEETKIKIPLQRQKNPVSREQQRINPSKTAAITQSQKQIPRSEAFEIVWDDQNQNAGESLAEMFKKRKKSLAERLDNQKVQAIRKEKGPEKTKEELFRLRKQMMGYKGHKVIKGVNNDGDCTNKSGSNNLLLAAEKELYKPLKPVTFEVTDCKRKKSREPNPALIERLAGGAKTKISKEEMVKLTNRRYEMLPEIQKKKDSDRKKEDLRNRKEKVKELEHKIKDAKYRHYNQYSLQ